MFLANVYVKEKKVTIKVKEDNEFLPLIIFIAKNYKELENYKSLTKEVDSIGELYLGSDEEDNRVIDSNDIYKYGPILVLFSKLQNSMLSMNFLSDLISLNKSLLSKETIIQHTLDSLFSK